METNKHATWSAAVIALGVMALMLLVMLAAIRKYSTVDEALKVWATFDTFVGLITGAVATYFFSRKATEAAKAEAESARNEATAVKELAGGAAQVSENAARAVERAHSGSVSRIERAHSATVSSMAGLVALAGQLDPNEWKQRLATEPALQRALRGDGLNA